MNNDLISREALRKALQNREECKKCTDIDCISCFYELIDSAPTVPQDCSNCKRFDFPYFVVKFDKEQMQELIDKAKAEVLASIERPQGEWIPVNERLPKQANQNYLVTVDYGKAGVSACQRFFFGEGIGWNDNSIIAWQPLPEPYKKGGAE